MFKIACSLLLSSTLISLADMVPVYLGSGTDDGIYSANLNSETGELSDLRNAVTTSGASSLALSKNKKYLYANGRIPGKKEGSVSAFSIEEDGSLKLINTQSSKGRGACHVSLDATSRCLFVANYSSGSISSYLLSDKGEISEAVSHHQHEGKSVHPDRQKGPHAHSIYSSPDNKYVYSADLGIDKVMIYKLNAETAELTKAGEVKTPAGGGARHMVFSKDGSKLYVLNELTLTVSLFSRNADSGTLTLLKTSAVIEKHLAFTNSLSCSEIQLSEDSRFIYAATRDLENKGRDSISVLDSKDLQIVQQHRTDGWIPRHFGVSPSGKWLLVAGQSANKVVVHALDPKTGKLEQTTHAIDLTKPMWILFP